MHMTEALWPIWRLCNKMKVCFEKALPQDARTLAHISERAFHSDVHHGAPSATGGPPGYASDRWQMRLMIAAEYYKIVVNDKIVGGVIVRPVAYQHYELIRIFYDSIGGPRFYSKYPRQVKDICGGLRRKTISKKFRTAGHLRSYLEDMSWSD